METTKITPVNVHHTCTSSPLEGGKDGSKREWINADTIDKIHVEQTGTPISNDPTVARIQREQALARHKRQVKGS